MPSRLPSAMTALATLWQAVTPPTDAALPYREARTPGELAGGAHRVFFQTPANARIVIEYGEATATFDYRWAVELRLSALRYDFTTLREACAHEGWALAAAVATEESWPAGVQDLRVEGTTIEVDEETAHVALVFELHALIQEDL